MNCDELLMLTATDTEVCDSRNLLDKKERLYSLAVCGKTKHYLGQQLTVEEIQLLSPEDIEKYHGRYESMLGSKMVRSIGQTVISLYTKIVGHFTPIDSEEDLTHDLTHDPVVSKSLESVACDLYYRFGSLLSPFVAGLITFNHINFQSKKDGGSVGDTKTDENSDTGTDENVRSENSDSKETW